MGAEQSVGVRAARFLADHDGVITTAQARDLGMTRGQLRARTERGLWVAHARSTFLSAEHRMTDMARVRIVANGYAGAVVDRTAAAWLHGLTKVLPDEVTLSLPRSSHVVDSCTVPASVCRRSFAAEDVTTVKGLATTALPLTVLAAAADLGDDGVALMDRALQIRCVTLKDLRSALERNAGSRGMRTARRLLRSAEDLSESELERKFVRFLNKHGVTGWTQQVWMGNLRMDFVFPAERVVVQLHGWAFHHDHEQWEKDQATTNALSAIGWVPLIFTWKRLEFAPDEVLTELMSTLDLRRSVD
ncbi:Protein of unknown function [Gordonia malaquae]|nr:Protein of unknown function [Gordonia malaquae]